MNHDEIRELLPAYAIGAVDPQERVTVEEHLATCAACRLTLRTYEGLAEDLLYAVPPVPAPSQVEERLQRAVGAPRRSRSWWHRPAARTLALAAAVVIFLLSNAFWAYRIQTISQEMRVQATALAVLAGAPRVVLQGDPPAPEARGVLYLRPETNVALLRISNLPPLPPDRAYQVWLIYDGHRDTGALFQVHQPQEIVVLIRAPRPLAEYEAIGITVEPASGSPGPTGPRVLHGSF